MGLTCVCPGRQLAASLPGRGSPCARASLTCNSQRPGGRRLLDAQATLPSSAGALRQQGRALSATAAKAAADTVFTLTSPRAFLSASKLTMYSISPLVQSYTTAGEAGVYAIGAAPTGLECACGAAAEQRMH